MLNVMRDNLRHLKWVLWAVALSLVIYLGAYFQGDSGADGASGWAVRVDGDSVPAQRFLDMARRTDQQYREILQDQYEELKPALQLGRQVAQLLADELIMLQEAERLGLRASDAEVAELIRTDPAFRDASGNFIGKERYTSVVQRSWLGGVPAFEANIAEQITIGKWKDLVTEPARLSDNELLAIHRRNSERASLDYALVSPDSQTIKEPRDAEITAWYAEHQEEYMRPESRRLRYLVVTRQSQLDRVSVSDDEVANFFEVNQAAFTRPEQRRASHILFRVEAGTPDEDKLAIRYLADSVLKRAQDGEDFGTMARSMSQDPVSGEQGGDLGWFGRGQMVSSFEQAVFETAVDQFAPVVESQFGFHVVKVTGSRPAGSAALDEVREDIRKRIASQRAQERALSEAGRIRGAIASASDLEVVAAQEGLLLESAVAVRGEPIGDLVPSPEFIDSAFGLPPGEVSPPVGVAQGLAIVTTDEILPPAALPLDEVRDRVRGEIEAVREREAALAAARSALDNSSDFAGALASLKVESRTFSDLTPGQGLPGIGPAPALDLVLFAPDSDEGMTGVVELPVGALVYQITARERFDPVRFEAEKETLRSEVLTQRRSALLQAILDVLRSKRSIEVNQDLVDRFSG